MVEGCVELQGALNLTVDPSQIPLNGPLSIELISSACIRGDFGAVRVKGANGERDGCLEAKVRKSLASVVVDIIDVCLASNASYLPNMLISLLFPLFSRIIA